MSIKVTIRAIRELNNIFHYLFVITLLISGISCSIVYYKPPVTGPVATVTFSNLSSELPDIYIISNCKALPVDRKLIEFKKPDEVGKYKTAIPANENISIRYVYDFIIKERTDLITSGNNLVSRVDSQESKYASSCESLISFKPEAKKHYEVYFGLVDENCAIKVSESTQTENSKKVLKNISGINFNDCKNR